MAGYILLAVALSQLLLTLTVLVVAGLVAYRLWPRDVEQTPPPSTPFPGWEGLAERLDAVDPTDAVIPDVWDPMFVGTPSGLGVFFDGDISQIAIPDDDILPPPDTPTRMPDGTIVINGQVIRSPEGNL